jgi:hypothetical protein
VLRRISGPKRNEVTGDWRKMHNEELQNLYSSPNIIRMIKSKGMRWVSRVAHMGNIRNAFKMLVVKSEEKRQLERPRRSCEYNIKKDLMGIALEGVDWIQLAQDRGR